MPDSCDPMDYITRQASLSVGFSKEYWSGLPFPSPGNLPDPGIKPGSPTPASSERRSIYLNSLWLQMQNRLPRGRIFGSSQEMAFYHAEVSLLLLLLPSFFPREKEENRDGSSSPPAFCRTLISLTLSSASALCRLGVGPRPWCPAASLEPGSAFAAAPTLPTEDLNIDHCLTSNPCGR